MCRTVHPSIVPNSGRLGATKQLLAWSTQLETESFRLVSFRFGSEHLWLIPRARIQPRINERDRKGRHEMNRSADRLNLCLSELKGAEQLKNFSLFFIIVRSRNDFLSRWKFKKRNCSLEIRISVSLLIDRIFSNDHLILFNAWRERMLLEDEGRNEMKWICRNIESIF